MTDVWRDASATRAPAILVRTPYGRDFEVPTPLIDPRVLASEGFAVVVQDVRGRGESDGVFDPFRQEAADGAASIDWVANQPWCDGRVVTAGSSYCGALQWLAASAGPPALAAIAPAFAAASFGEGWMRRGGALELGFVASWIAGLLGPAERLWLDDVERSYRETEALSDMGPWVKDWLHEASDSDYWGGLAADPSAVDLPVLALGGWYDIFIDGTLRAWASSQHPHSRLVIGPWAHDETLSHIIGERNFGSAGSGAASHHAQRMAGFFKAAVDGDEPEGPRVSAYVMGDRQWLALPGWPPPGARVARLPLEPGMFMHDALHPPPSLGGRCLRIAAEGGVGFGAKDQTSLTARPDVLRISVPTLALPLVLAGPVAARLRVEPAPDAARDWVCTLCVKEASGRLLNLTEGIRRTRGSEGEVRIELGDVCAKLDRGQELVALIAAASFPRWDARGDSGRRVVLPGSALEVTLA